MKIVQELVHHFYRKGELSIADLELLKAHGFEGAVRRFLGNDDDYDKYDYDPWGFSAPEIELETDIIEQQTTQSLDEGFNQAKKGKGQKPKTQRLSLETFIKALSGLLFYNIRF